MPTKNLFATVLTYAAPSANYRGESEENRTVLQKIQRGGAEYAVVSPESIRNALREQIASYGLPCNRRRLHDEGQLAVEFKEVPNADKYADDFLFGYMVADSKQVPKGHPSKRDSVLRMNMAVALAPYRYEATFHQSPANRGASPWQNDKNSALFHKEVTHTAYQYPFALAGDDCAVKADWVSGLLRAIGELSNVAGGHARSYFEFAPRSIVARLTSSLVAGIDTYGFNERGEFPELKRLSGADLPASEFWLGGEIVRTMPGEVRERLSTSGAHLYENPVALLNELGAAFLGR